MMPIEGKRGKGAISVHWDDKTCHPLKKFPDLSFVNEENLY